MGHRSPMWAVLMMWTVLLVACSTPVSPIPADHSPEPAPPLRIAFGSDREGDPHVYAINIDGSGLERLTDLAGPDMSLSPDGQRLAVNASQDSSYDIYLVNIDNHEAINITQALTTPTSYLAWSPDGEQLAFLSEWGGDTTLHVVSASGVELATTIFLDTYVSSFFRTVLSWSPDGRQIAFAGERVPRVGWGFQEIQSDIYTVTWNRAIVTQLTDEEHHTDRLPRWSPDGRRILFVSTRDGNDEIYLMNPDGSDVVNLTRHPGNDFAAFWSPDGSRIAFLSDRDGSMDLFVMMGEGTEQRNLTNGLGDVIAAFWSPEGSWIAFNVREPDLNWEIYVVRPDGSNLHNVTQHPAGDGCIDWFPPEN